MKMFMLFFLILLAPVASIAQDSARPTDEQIAIAVEASNKTRGEIAFWQSPNLDVIFGYDERWKPSNPSHDTTSFVVNWSSKKTGGLMATCYLEANASGLGTLEPAQIPQNAQLIVDAYLRNGRLRDPNMKLVSWQSATQDNHPVIYMERDLTVTTLNETFHARAYSVVTSWHGHEINMECASTIPLTMPKMAGIVEGPIKKILGSLVFVRTK